MQYRLKDDHAHIVYATQMVGEGTFAYATNEALVYHPYGSYLIASPAQHGTDAYTLVLSADAFTQQYERVPLAMPEPAEGIHIHIHTHASGDAAHSEDLATAVQKAVLKVLEGERRDLATTVLKAVLKIDAERRRMNTEFARGFQ